MKKTFALFIYTFCTSLVWAQEINKIPFKVGQQLYINPCGNKPEYVGIELYSRSTPYDKTGYDSLTGVGFTKVFFNTSSLDGKRLPCSMGGRKYTIAAIEYIKDKDGITHRAIALYDYYHLNILWVDYDVALAQKEINIPTRKSKKKKKK
jgi:hypothetical protein